MPRVALVNLGCRVNRVELDTMALRLQEAGAELVSQREADAIVIIGTDINAGKHNLPNARRNEFARL